MTYEELLEDYKRILAQVSGWDLMSIDLPGLQKQLIFSPFVIKKATEEYTKDLLTSFLDFLLKEGYCDSDVYSESPTAIDKYLHPELK